MSVINQVTDGLYVGNFATACNLKLLREFRITHILIVASGLAPRFPDNFCYLQFPAEDLPDYNLFQHFSDAYEFISEARKQKGRVFVHCAMGKSRSCTIVIAYLMKNKNWSVERAWGYLRDRHPGGYPNVGFLRQLKVYESMVFDPSAASLDFCACQLI